MMSSVLQYLVLPKEVTAFEASYLQRMNRIAIAFFWLHLPVFAAIAFFNDTGVFAAVVMTSAVLIGPSIAMRSLPPRQTSVVFGFTAMCMGALLVHFGQGMVQIEMHFYFFVLLALLAVFANPLVIVVAAATAAVHHAVFWLLLPQSVFNYAAPIWVVGVHAAFVVLESVAACFVARSFFDNVIGLEKIVQKATSALDARNRDMRLILDTVQQGFVTVDLHGALASERSAILDSWLGVPAPGDSFFSWLAHKDPSFSTWMRLSFDTITDDFLPVEVALEQMPRRWKLDGRELELTWLLLPERAGLLLTMTDITASLQAAAAEASRQEMAALVERLMQDRLAVAEFVQEADDLVTQLQSRRYDNAIHARRLAHTLKGNAAFFGLRRLAEAAHEFEAGFTDDGVADTSAMVALWQETLERVRPFLSDDGQLQISLADLECLREVVRTGASTAAILELVESFRAEPASRRLQRMGEQVRAVGQRLGKAVEVHTIIDDRLRVPGHLRVFWPAAIHLLRNAVDHGIEDGAWRSAHNKRPMGRITLTASEVDGSFVLEVDDDGRGIDWDTLKRKATQLGLPAATENDLIEALFTDGVSTRDEATDISGRGVGMAAVRQVVREQHGDIELRSLSGVGTRVIVRFPVETAAREHEATAH
jgi:two-component system chemotaxis sensor kinase CheA